MLERLDSVLSEEKAEEEQKFKVLVKEDDDEQLPFNQDPAPLSSEETSEEKTQDNDVSSNADNVSDQWELISERSGSAIVISINGSLLSGGGSASHFLRCASPSLLKNKFVLTEYTGESSYLEHVVLPTDTLQGLCLAYKVSATQLRMVNKFSGNSLQMAPKKIKIPMNGVTKGMMIKTQDKTSKEFKLYAFVAEIPTMELIEAKAYLDLCNWDLDEGLRSAREDIDYGWDYYNNGSGAESPAIPMFASSVTAKPKDLTVQDIYDGAAAFEGDGVELKDIPKLSKDDER
jgi:LysM repeat protein